MKQVHSLLAEGNGHGARARVSALLSRQPDQASATADIIANILWTNYEQFHVQAVHDFRQNLELELPAVVVERIEQSLGPKLERTQAWTRTLRGVTQERLVRECRNLIVLNDLKAAALRARALLERAADETELDDSCQYLARGMAELTRDHERCLNVIGLVMKAGGPAGGVGAGLVASHFTQMSREFTTIRYQAGDQAWVRNQTEAMLTLRAYLPGPNEVGEPEPAQLEKFYDEVHAIVRAGMAQRNPDDFIDALWVIADYCPADPSPVRNAGGVEDRMFVQLGPRAKLTAVRAMTGLGEIEPLRTSVMRLAHSGGIYNQARLLSAIMGGLRQPEFLPWLNKALDKVGNDGEERMLIEALGRIGSPQAIDLLLARLSESLRNKTRPRQAERIETLLVAFGRISRQPGQDPELRNDLTLKVMKAIGSADKHLSFRTAEVLFSNRLEEIRPELKAWAAEKTVEAMWGQPLRTETGAVATSGWREPMVGQLIRLGPEMLPIVLHAATRHATTYSGAMGALARSLEQIGDDRAVPVLETMARTALLHQANEKRSRLLDEKVVDAATGETHDLDRDDVIHTLLFTLLRVGGDAGLRFVLELADQVQAGRFESPGQQTVNLLVDTKVKYGRLDQVAHEIEEAAAIDEKTFKSALSDARGGLLTKRVTRISAIAALGGARRLEAVGVLLDALGDKDAIVSSAAYTALAQYLLPIPNEKAFGDYIDALLERETGLKGRLLERLLEFIRREVPRNAPYDRLFDRQVEIDIEDGALAHQLRAAVARPEGTSPGAAGDGDQEDAYAAAAKGPLSDLDKKRAYLQARRDWIARGKVGDPPATPK